MQIGYQNTSGDLRAVMRHLPVGQRIRLRFGWILQLYGCTIPGCLLLLASGRPLVPLAAWAVLGLLAVARAIALARPDHSSTDLPAITLRFEPEYLECETAQGCGRRDWSLVERVRVAPDFLLLYLAQNRLFAIPRRAVESGAQLEQAAAAARRGIKRARQRRSAAAPVPDRIPIPRSERLAEEPEPIEVQFRNTAGEIARVRQFGLQQPAGPVASGLTLVLLAAVMSLFMAFGFRDRGADGIMASTLFLLLSVFACLWIWTLLRPLLDARAVSPEFLRPLTLTLGGSGVWLRSSTVSSFERWSGFEAVQANRRYLALARRGRQELVLIPKSAFRDAHHLQQFEQLSREAILAARAEEQPDPGEAGRPVVETGNPYQPPSL